LGIDSDHNSTSNFTSDTTDSRRHLESESSNITENTSNTESSAHSNPKADLKTNSTSTNVKENATTAAAGSNAAILALNDNREFAMEDAKKVSLSKKNVVSDGIISPSSLPIYSELIHEVTPAAMWAWDDISGKVVNVLDRARPEIRESTFGQASQLSAGNKRGSLVETGAFASNQYRFNLEGKWHLFYGLKCVFYLLYQVYALVKLAMISLIQGRNMQPRGSPSILKYLRLILMASCLADIVLFFSISLIYYVMWDEICGKETLFSPTECSVPFALILLVWPFAIVITPLLGFTVLLFGSIGNWPRVYSGWSRVTVFPIVTMVYTYNLYPANARAYTVYFLGAVIFSRAFQCVFIDLYIAHLECYRRTRGWDGLSTSLTVAKDYEDVFLFL
jgi:hypothetical protein